MISFRRRRSTLRMQLILLLLFALAIVQSVSIWLFIGERESAILATLAQDGASRVLSVAAALETSGDEIQNTIMNAAESHEFSLSLDTAAMLDAATFAREDFLTEELTFELGAPAKRRLAIALHATDPAAVQPSGSDHDWDLDPYELVVSATLEDGRWLNARIDIGGPPLRWALPALASFALSGVAVTLIVWILIGRIARPLNVLACKAERLGRGEAIGPVECSGPLEIQTLTVSFDEMATRLNTLLSERATMLAALGHDLRSPLTAMRLRLEFIDDEETKERMECCLDEMQILVQSALAMAKGADMSEIVTTFDLGQMLEGLVEELREAGGNAILRIETNVPVHARRNSLKRAVRNVAENAVRYGNAAYIRLDARKDRAQIVIDDEGPGIPPEDRERVFSPFVRLEASRNRQTGGSGLGLAIAKIVIESEKGTIEISDRHGIGTRMIISLPRT